MHDSLLLRVARMEPLTPRVSAFTLVATDGAALPGWAAGAHIEVEVEPTSGKKAHRAYSLVMRADDEPGYEIAVQREDGGTGGSRYMHRLKPGDLVRAKPPTNHFVLASPASEHVLIAGGIGITPILSMARTLLLQAQAYELHYAARAPELMPYWVQVQALPESSLYFDGGDPRQGVPLETVLARPSPQRHLYVCGPKGLIDAAIQIAQRLGWPASNVHYELFAGALSQAGDAAFDVECAQTGQVFVVPPGRSILDVLVEHGLDPLFDCRTGSCGVCVAPVLQGTPDHRDSTLTASEKSAGDRVCICVSRALSPRLVLDF